MSEAKRIGWGTDTCAWHRPPPGSLSLADLPTRGR